MAHYALLDTNNVVTDVIVGRDETDHTAGVTDWEAYYGHVLDVPAEQVKRTSYNTHNGEHLTGGTPFRGNYAGIGYTYDLATDEFVPPPAPDPDPDPQP
jgi:hypothetical protein